MMQRGPGEGCKWSLASPRFPESILTRRHTNPDPGRGEADTWFCFSVEISGKYVPVHKLYSVIQYHVREARAHVNWAVSRRKLIILLIPRIQELLGTICTPLPDRAAVIKTTMWFRMINYVRLLKNNSRNGIFSRIFFDSSFRKRP